MAAQTAPPSLIPSPSSADAVVVDLFNVGSTEAWKLHAHLAAYILFCEARDKKGTLLDAFHVPLQTIAGLGETTRTHLHAPLFAEDLQLWFWIVDSSRFAAVPTVPMTQLPCVSQSTVMMMTVPHTAWTTNVHQDIILKDACHGNAMLLGMRATFTRDGLRLDVAPPEVPRSSTPGQINLHLPYSGTRRRRHAF